MTRLGFTLIELSIVMGVVAVLTTAILPVAVRSIEIKAGEKTITEVGIIQAAARKFHDDHRSWPSDLAQMRTLGYISPQWSLLNPWNDPYQISYTDKLFSVVTMVPVTNIRSMLSARLPQSTVDGSMVASAIGSGDGQLLASGIIVAWSGMIAEIPVGWALCDGNNGTPDLRDKFVIGARQDDNGIAKTNVMGSLTQEGGKISHDHSAVTGTHVLTIAEMPAHSHNIMVNDRTTSGPANSPYPEVADLHSTRPYPSTSAGQNQPHTHAISSDLNAPPYYALAFIMKL